MNLQETAAFRPLPGEFVMLAQIATRASQYKIVNAVSRNVHASYAAQGKRVINMEDILPSARFFHALKFALAVVACMFLPLELPLDLGGSVFPWNGMKTSTTPMSAKSRLFRVGLPILFYSFWMTFTKSSRIFSKMLWVLSIADSFQISPMPPRSFSIATANLSTVFCLVVVLLLLPQSLCIGLTPDSHLLLTCNPIVCLALPAMRHQAAFLVPLRVEKLRSSSIPLLTPWALLFAFMFHQLALLGSMTLLFRSLGTHASRLSLAFFLFFCPILVGLSIFFTMYLILFLANYTTTFLTERIQRPLTHTMKVVGCSREPSLTGTSALLARGILGGYNITHGRSSLLLSSCQRLFAVALWQHNIYTPSIPQIGSPSKFMPLLVS